MNLHREETVELLKKILVLEEAHAHLQQKVSRLIISNILQNSGGAGQGSAFKANSSSFRQSTEIRTVDVNCHKNSSFDGFTEARCKHILQAIGQAVLVYDLNLRIVYWNHTSETLYGYTAAEVLGKTPVEILLDPKDFAVGTAIIKRTTEGEGWAGQFPIRNNRGERFVIISNNTPLRDENGTIIGGLSITSDARQYEEMRRGLCGGMLTTIASTKLGLHPQQSLQTTVASKLSNLASKVKSKIETGEKHMDHEDVSGVIHYTKHLSPDVVPSEHEDALTSEASTPRGHIDPSPFGVFSSMGTECLRGKPMTYFGEKSELKPSSNMLLSSKVEAWTGEKGLAWPWKRNEREGNSSDSRTGPFGSPQLQKDQENEYGPQMNSISSAEVESQLWENKNHSPGSPSSSFNKADEYTHIPDYEILWRNLIVREQIGQGSHGTVFHGLLHGSDVVLKVFMMQDYSDDVIMSFRQEVCLMKRLLHPNILLFMGAVISPQRLCILTEFVPRGNLFQLLRQKTVKLDWRRRVQLAMDTARGMNYLHQCHPPILHRNLKSSNLLVDKNLIVKVGDFGLSCLKQETYLTKGTCRWMAPEILRNEQANEKSDVYSYGVVLWEITTEKIPWHNLSPIQVVGSVGFLNQRLDIPDDVDPQWASLIESCWCSEPKCRPTFQEILDKLKSLQKKFAVQHKAKREK